MDTFTLATIIIVAMTVIFFIIPMISPTKSYGSTSQSGMFKIWKFIHSANYSAVWRLIGIPVSLVVKLINRRKDDQMINGNYSAVTTSTGNNHIPDNHWQYEYGEDCGDYRLGDSYNGILVSFKITPIQQDDGSIIVYIYEPHIPEWQQDSYSVLASKHMGITH